MERDIYTYTGDIELTDSSHVQGDIIVKSSESDNKKRMKIVISVTGNSIVDGDIIVKSNRIDVQVIKNTGGMIKGTVEGAEILEDQAI